MRSTSGPTDADLAGDAPFERAPEVSALVLETEPRRRPWLRIAAALGAVVVALYFAGHWFLYDRHRVYTDDAIVDTDQVYVTTRADCRILVFERFST